VVKIEVVGLMEGDFDGKACGTMLGASDRSMDGDIDGAMLASPDENIGFIDEGRWE